MIDKAKCQALRLPAPKIKQSQPNYVLACIAAGHSINTRIGRYIGIGNLHTVISNLKKRKSPPSFTVEHDTVWCPSTNTVPKEKVDVAYMTSGQRKLYTAMKKPAKT